MNDIVITGNNETLVNDRKKYLQSKFRMKDLGTLKYLSSRICFSQRKHALKLISESGFAGSEPSTVPMD